MSATGERLSAMDTETLYVSSIDVKPINVDSWTDLLSPDDGIDGAAYWETFDHETYNGESHTLLSDNGRVSGVVIDGSLFTDYAEYADDWRDSHGGDTDDDTPALSESDWDSLMEAEPYESGVEGPMMNYWYPVESIDSDDRAESAAVSVDGLPLCVVRVGEVYGLALTGGGMDLSWDICEAYIRTGNLPPVHFADLPSFAGGYGQSPAVLAAMRRSLTITAERATRSLARLADTFGD